ncbi:MAG TPA: MFS transporter [Candidatus Binatia bacterium]|jgi:MFS family permease|nr:MFS transporter [Candidatus Binatia bacterium]
MNETQSSLKQSLQALPRGAWILFFGTFLNKFGTFVLPFLAIYMTRLGYSAPQAGLAMAAYGIGTLGACLLGGYLADRLGRRKTIVLSMLSVALAMAGLSQVRALPLIVCFSGLAGLTGELYRPASSALLADLVPAGQRVTAFAAYRMALNAGWAFGPATAGLLAKHSYVWLFVGDAVTSVLYGLVALFALPAGLRGAGAGNTWLETFRVLRDDRRFRQVICAALAVGLVFVQVFSTMSLQITRSGLSASTYGLVISLNGVLIVLCELPLTTITKRYPPRRVMALGFLLIGAGFASNALVRTIPLLVLTVVLFTFGETIAMPVSGAYVADLAPPEQRGLYMGTYGMIWAVAFVCGPSLGLLLFSASPLALWLSCGALGILAASIIMAGPRRCDEFPAKRPLELAKR